MDPGSDLILLPSSGDEVRLRALPMYSWALAEASPAYCFMVEVACWVW